MLNKLNYKKKELITKCYFVTKVPVILGHLGK